MPGQQRHDTRRKSDAGLLPEVRKRINKVIPTSKPTMDGYNVLPRPLAKLEWRYSRPILVTLAYSQVLVYVMEKQKKSCWGTHEMDHDKAIMKGRGNPVTVS